MAKLTIGQKANRVLRLLLGLRNPRVAGALHQYGFTHQDLEEGWRLLKALTDGRLALRPIGKQDPALLVKLDEWENQWFPIASASLRSRFPKAHDYLFLNLTQTEGTEVIVSVGTMVQRLQRMSTEPSLGAEGAEARALLERRGLNAIAIQTATTLLESLGTVAADPLPPQDAAENERAEAAMWDWYLEWGEIARVALSERRLLKELGFLNAKRPVSEEDAEEQDEVEAPVVAVNGGGS